MKAIVEAGFPVTCFCTLRGHVTGLLAGRASILKAMNSLWVMKRNFARVSTVICHCCRYSITKIFPLLIVTSGNGAINSKASSTKWVCSSQPLTFAQFVELSMIKWILKKRNNIHKAAVECCRPGIFSCYYSVRPWSLALLTVTDYCMQSNH